MQDRIAVTWVALSLICVGGCTGSVSGELANGNQTGSGGSVSGLGGAVSGSGGGGSGGGGNQGGGGAGGEKTDTMPTPPRDGGLPPVDGPNDANGGEVTGPISTTMALNIRLQKVEITQAVSITLGPDASGAAMAVSARNGKVVENRITLIRVHYAVATGWVARGIEAVLYLSDPAGAGSVLPQTKTISASSDAATLDGTFNWTLSEVQVVAGLKAHVELHELLGSAASGSALDSPRFPRQDEVDLGIQGGPMQVVAVLVPVTVGGTTVPVTPADVQTWGDFLQGVYPIQKSFITVHKTVDPGWTKYGDDQEDPGFDLCAQLKATDKTDPNVYHVLLIPGTKATVGFDGTSDMASDKPSDAASRCSQIITDRTNTLPRKALVFAHELGHAHGLDHAPCGGADGPDPKYPYPKALIGVQGYSILKKVLFDPNKTSDLMSYCEPAWISDYFWNKLETRVRIQTSWGIHHRAEDQLTRGSPVEGRSVRGLFRGAGEINWAVIIGEVSEPVPAVDSFVRPVDGKRAGGQLPFLSRKLTSSHGLSEFRFTLPVDNDATAFDVRVAGVTRRLNLADIRDLSR